MTRGYVCVVNGTKIKKVAYLQSDAYLSCYGLKILQAIKDGTIDTWMDKQIAYNHECYGSSEPSPQFSLLWFRKGKENKDWDKYDFVEYGYLYNEKDGSLKVYSCGNLVLAVSQEDREKYLYYFQHYSQIDSWLRYDEEKLDENYKKPIKNLVKEASIEMLKEWVEESEKPRLELSDTHCLCAGHTMEYPIYQKLLRMSNDYGKTVKFIVAKDRFSKKWEVMVQLPYCRAVIQRNFSSESKATDFIRSLAKANPQKLMRMAEICIQIDNAYINNERDTLRGIMRSLDEMWEEEPWYTPNGSFTPQQIKNNYARIL